MSESNGNSLGRFEEGEERDENPWTSENLRRLEALRRRLENLDRRDRELKERLLALEDKYIEAKMEGLMNDLEDMLRDEGKDF